METCTIETGLLRKKPCGQPSVTHCVNCEQALCSQHAVAQHSEAGQKTGKFLCKECDAAWREQAKSVAKVAKSAPPAKKPAEPAKAAPPKPAPPKEAPAKEAPAEPKPKDGGSGGLDFK